MGISCSLGPCIPGLKVRLFAKSRYEIDSSLLNSLLITLHSDFLALAPVSLLVSRSVSGLTSLKKMRLPYMGSLPTIIRDLLKLLLPEYHFLWPCCHNFRITILLKLLEVLAEEAHQLILGSVVSCLVFPGILRD